MDLIILDTSQNRLKKLSKDFSRYDNLFCPHDPLLPNDLIKLQPEDHNYIQGNYIPDNRDDLMKGFADASSFFSDYVCQKHKGNLPYPELWTEHNGVVCLMFGWTGAIGSANCCH